MNRILVGLSSLSLVVLAGCGDVTPPGNGGDGADAFVPLPDPTVGSIDPARGPLGGGTTVTLTGSGFSDNADMNTVIVGALVASDVTVNSDTELTFVTPAGFAAGAAAVTVFNEAGAIMSDVSFTYNDLPVITGIDIDTGSAAGGLEVTVTGSGFSAFDAGTNTVEIGGTEGTNVDVDSDTELSFDTGAHSGAPFEFLDLSVSNANGTAVLAESFRYLKPGLLAAQNSQVAIEGVHLMYIDPANGDTISLGLIGGGTMDRGISGMQPTGDGLMYASASRQFSGCCGRILITFDPLDPATTTTIGPQRNSVTSSDRALQDLAVVGTTLYGINESSRRLVSVNTTNGEYTDIGANQIGSTRPSSLTPDGNGGIYWARRSNNPLRILNVANGTFTDLATLQGDGNKFGGLAIFNNVLYGVTVDTPAALMVINPNTGVLQEIGELPAGLDSLVATPW
jgi:hypothetical protein